MCNFNLGMVGWALLHRLHRNSIDIRLSSSFSIAFPSLLSSSSTSTESRKKAVLKEFQCFLFFKCAELKSWLITCRCSCRIDGSWNRRHRKCLLGSLHFHPQIMLWSYVQGQIYHCQEYWTGEDTFLKTYINHLNLIRYQRLIYFSNPTNSFKSKC